MDEVAGTIADKQPGDQVELTLAHGPDTRTVTVTLGDQPATAKP
jgi:S1-C subfamily serine protease